MYFSNAGEFWTSGSTFALVTKVVVRFAARDVKEVISRYIVLYDEC